MRVYIAGPIAKGRLEENIRNAMDAAKNLMDNGLYPYVPHYNCFFQITHPRAQEDFMRLDFAFLEVCDAVLRIPGESIGADREVRFADHIEIPVFYTMSDLLTWVNDEKKMRELAINVPRLEPPEV